MIKYTDKQLALITDRILEYIAPRLWESAPISNIVELIRHDLKFKVPGRQDELLSFIRSMGFTVELCSRKTHGPAEVINHGGCYWRVSL